MEFDSRMTQETKEFVKENSPIFDKMASIDPKQANEMLDEMVEESISKTNFANITEKEYKVDSLYDNFQIPVTAYIPKTVSPTSSIVVFFHGGGFKLFTRKIYRNTVSFLADHSNTIWLSVEYRLSPEFKHPTQIQDCVSVTKWVIENKNKIFNASQDAYVGVCGDSAGGNLAALVAIELKDAIKFQILVYPWLDLTDSSEYYKEFAKHAYLLPDERTVKAINDYLLDTSLVTSPNVSPMFAKDISGLPKCFLLNAEMDPLVGDAYSYHNKLQDSGVSSEMYVVKGTVHSFFHAFFDYKNAFLEGAVEILGFLNKI
jgi:acetyl esterase